MRILALIGLLACLAGCSRSRSLHHLTAESGADTFQKRYSVEGFQDACNGGGRCEETLRTVFALLGPMKSTKLAEPTATSDYLLTMTVRLIFDSEYQRGRARERFVWTEHNGLDHNSYEIEVDFSDLAIRHWTEFHKKMAAGSFEEACGIAKDGSTCREQLASVTASLGKAEVSREEFAGTVTRSRQKPFPSSIRLETRSHYANGDAIETFDWEIRPEGFRNVRFAIEAAR